MITDFFNQNTGMVSLDIETTGLSPGKDRIWSIGLATSSHNGNEYFIDLSGKNSAAETRDILTKDGGAFSEKQMESGSFDDLFDAIAKKKAVSEKRAIELMFNGMNKNSVVLIQNANFENMFISQAMDALDIKTPDFFKFMTPDSTGKNEHPVTREKISTRMLYTPPEVTNLRRRAGQEIMGLHRGVNSSEDIAKTYSEMVQEYGKAIGQGNGAVVVDLQDITKAVYAKAGARGLTNSSLINVGTSVEYLTQLLFGETEKHTALKDGQHQLRIFAELESVWKDLDNSTLKPETEAFFEKRNTSVFHELERQMNRAVVNTLEEISIHGQTAINLESFNPDIEIDVLDSDGSEHTVMVNKRTKAMTKHAREAVENVAERYSWIIGQDAAEKMAEEYSNAGTEDDIKAFAEYRANKAQERVVSSISGAETERSILEASVQSGPYIPKDKTSTLSANTESRGGIISTIMEHRKTSAVLAAVGGLAIIETQTAPTPIDMKHRARNLDDSFNIYNKTYHGSGFADWNDRIGHGEF